jgi:site-specific DNA-methyltransferase (adenine-specific)
MDKINQVVLQDCVEGLKELPSKCAQIVICDCPYNIGKDFNNNSDKQPMEQYLSWCDEWITECLRVLKDNGTMYIYGFSETLAFIRVRLTCNVRWLIWHYTNKNVPSLKFWQRSHESILCCWKKEKVFNVDDVREPYTDTFLKNAAGKQRKSTKGRFSKGETETTYKAHEKGALPRDVIKVSALAGGAGKKERVAHPTQKPMELCRKLLFASKQNTTDLVIIPFAGSGSECVACKELGLPFIGFEINEEYVELCKKRLEDPAPNVEEEPQDEVAGECEASSSGASESLSNNEQ